MRSSIYIYLLIMRLISLTGDAIFSLGFPLYIFHKTGSVQNLSIAFALDLSVYMIFTFLGGYIADQRDIRKVVYKLDFLLMAVILLGGLYFSSHFSLHIAYTFLILLAAIRAIYNVCFDKIPILYLSGERLTKALSYFQVMRDFSPIVGLPLAGIVVSLVSIQSIFFINALTFFLPAVYVWYMVPTRTTNTEANVIKKAKLFSKQSLDGFSIIWKSPLLWQVTILAIFLNIVLSIYSANWVVLFKTEFNIPDRGLGFIYGMAALVGIIGTIWLGNYLKESLVRVKGALVVAQLFVVAGGALIYFSDSLWGLALSCILLSTGGAFHALPSTWIRKEVSGRQNYGKVLAAARIVSRTFSPMAMALAVFLMNTMSIKEIFLFASIICLVQSILPIFQLISYRDCESTNGSLSVST